MTEIAGLTPERLRSYGRIEVIPRDDFLHQWRRDYMPGQHVTMIGPTQRGKTTLCVELLRQVISPEMPVVALAGKPPGRDATMEGAARRLNLRTIEDWPPTAWEKWQLRRKHQNGYLLRPRQTMRNLTADQMNLREQFRRAMISCYSSKTPVIIWCDEGYLVYWDMKLRHEYEAPLTRGAPVCAMWSNLQRGAYMSYHAYSAPEHIFIFYDSDAANRKRYRDLGCVDPRYVEAVIAGLHTERIPSGQTISEALYIRRAGPELAIVAIN